MALMNDFREETPKEKEFRLKSILENLRHKKKRIEDEINETLSELEEIKKGG